MTKEEKVLLDQLFTSAQNIIDYMRKNNYMGYASITVNVDKDGEMYDSISVHGAEFDENNHSKRTYYKEMNCLNETPAYREFEWENE